MDTVTKKYRTPRGSGGWVEGYDEHEITMYRFKSIDNQWTVTMHEPKFKLSEFRERLKAYDKSYRRHIGRMSNTQLTEYFNLSNNLIQES